MKEVSNIKFVDASYFLEDDDKIPDELTVYEAYGYVRRNRDTIVLAFIEKIDEQEEHQIIKGLLIPERALVSKQSEVNSIDFENVKAGSRVAVDWCDVVYVANTDREECSTMRSVGILEKMTEAYIVLKEPETMRINPLPNKKHPENNPARYMIPLSLIRNMINSD